MASNPFADEQRAPNAGAEPAGIDAKAAPAIIRASEADWVEAAKYAIVMKGLSTAQWPAVMGIGLLGLLLYQHVDGLRLLTWLALALTVAVLRFHLSGRYQRQIAAQPVDVQLAYVRRLAWFWPLYAFSWASASALFFGTLTPRVEVVCWMLIAGVAGVAIAWTSAHRRVTRLFLFSFMACVAVSVAWHQVADRDHTHEANWPWLPGLLGVYLLLLLRTSGRLHDLYADSIDLRYHNARLIHSLQRQTRAAEEAAAFKGRFLASAAHDLKQPVNALGIYAEWLSNEPELVHELGPKILQAAQAINDLFDSMFDLIKADSGRLQPEVREIDVARLMSDLEVQFGPLAMQKGITLRVRPAGVRLRSDPILLQRILANLLTNAIRYTARGGVLFGLRREAGALRFEVWDTGIGVALDQQEPIFGEFYKVPSAGTEEGFGLGLAIVGRLSALLGYEVSMKSRPGRGSVFRLRVPLPAPDPEPPIRR